MFANVNSVQENKKKNQIIIKTNRLQLDYKAKEKDEFWSNDKVKNEVNISQNTGLLILAVCGSRHWYSVFL